MDSSKVIFICDFGRIKYFKPYGLIMKVGENSIAFSFLKALSFHVTAMKTTFLEEKSWHSGNADVMGH